VFPDLVRDARSKSVFDITASLRPGKARAFFKRGSIANPDSFGRKKVHLDMSVTKRKFLIHQSANNRYFGIFSD